MEHGLEEEEEKVEEVEEVVVADVMVVRKNYHGYGPGHREVLQKTKRGQEARHRER